MSALSGQDEVVRSGVTPSALPLGSHDVVVINPDGQTATLGGGFVILDANAISERRLCGCGVGAASGAPWLIGLVLAWRRRRVR